MTFRAIPPPYTEITTDFNFKPREVWCKYCKYKVMTAIPDPKCSMCHHSLITVLKDKEKE